MKKHLSKIAVFLLTALLCTGCGTGAGSQLPSGTTVEYSNLVDSASQEEVTNALTQHGVSAEQTDTLLAWANDFNSRVTSGTLPDGFHTTQNEDSAYQGLIIENKELEDGSFAPEANCRLTSYLLMKHLIQTSGTPDENDVFLMFDLEAIDTYAPFHLSDTERNQFLSLFNSVSVDGTDTVEEHIERIQNAWKDRGIQIDGDGISLITVYLHSPFEQLRFVGHTGVLLDSGDGLLFVEKYGPQFPFQATKFHDRSELTQYLLSRADLYGDDSELAPIVLENDQVIS